MRSWFLLAKVAPRALSTVEGLQIQYLAGGGVPGLGLLTRPIAALPYDFLSKSFRLPTSLDLSLDLSLFHVPEWASQVG